MKTKANKPAKSNIAKMAIVGVLSDVYGIQCSADAGIY